MDEQPHPVLDYMSKDYQSLRRLMLDRLATTLPAWRERHEADLGVALVEAMAYLGDRLSYFQDAVATEAYLRTARRRISVRRHARLINHVLHEGCNARAWMHLQVSSNTPVHLKQSEIIFVARAKGGGPYPDDETARLEFWPLRQGNAVLRAELNFMTIVSELSVGSTRAQIDLAEPGWLQRGKVLVLELTKGGRPVYHPVMLVSPARLSDDGRCIITWDADDALPFTPDHAGGRALGNIILAQHGKKRILKPYEFVQQNGRLRLNVTDTTHSAANDEPVWPSAAAMASQNPQNAKPRIEVKSKSITQAWRWRRDLLSSKPSDHDFCVEFDDAGQPVLRFGDGGNGAEANLDDAGLKDLEITHWSGNGPQGNVPAFAITQICYAQTRSVPDGIGAVFNPLPARGGMERESVEAVRLLAPDRIASKQKRAVTPEDYAELASQVTGVQLAAARIRRDGVRSVVEIAVQPTDLALPPVSRDAAKAWDGLKTDIEKQIEPFRRINHAPVIVMPRYIEVDIRLRLVVVSTHDPREAAARVTTAIEGMFVGRKRLAIGQSLHWSKLVAVALREPGVANVAGIRFNRAGRGAVEGTIDIGPLELARLITPKELLVEI